MPTAQSGMGCMPSAPSKPESALPKRIALINPTKFLGNLLLAGGLMQALCQACQQQGVALLVVLDASFKELLADALPGAQIVYYPRRELSRGVSFNSARLWLDCVRQIRAFAPELAFTIEEDSVCHRLTHFSGAKHKVSSTVHRYHWGFDQVLDIPRSGRRMGEEGIWYSFRDVFSALDLPVAASLKPDGHVVPAYVRLTPPPPGPVLTERLTAAGVDLNAPIAVLHAGASKHYKQWPVNLFAELATQLVGQGYQLLLIGAGKRDAAVNEAITQALSAVAVSGINLCNELSLAELASLLTCVDVMVGNDSGPSHLASALGVRGVVIFGPTDLAIWRPLGGQTTALQQKQVCAHNCTRHRCDQHYACLQAITPDQVMTVLTTNSL